MKDLGLTSRRIEIDPEVLKVRKDPFWLIDEGKLWIKTKKGELIRLVPNRAQRRVLELVRKRYNEGKPVRLIILKSRQQGISTICEAIIFCLTIAKHNITSMVVADDTDDADHVFDMNKVFHELLEEKFKEKKKKSNAKVLEFDRIRSKIKVETANNQDVGTTVTLQNLHTTEVAYWKNGAYITAGLNQCIPEEPFTIYIEESTANGAGGYFYEKYQSTKDGSSDWDRLFLEWWLSEDYTMEVPEGFTLGDSNMCNGDDEIAYHEKYSHLTMGQMAWRRNAIKNKCNGDLDMFCEKYPSNDIEAFRVSGRCRFNKKILRKIQDSKDIINGEIGELRRVGKKQISFTLDSDGDLTIFKKPEKGHRYAIGTDTREAIVKEGRGSEEERSDWNVAIVFDVKTLEQVAQLRNRYEGGVLADNLQVLGDYYRNAFNAVERNKGEYVVLTLRNNGYSNLYYEETFDKDSQQTSKKLGWHTNVRTKRIMIDHLAKALIDETITIHSKVLLNELMTFIRLVDGKAEAQSGCFDDCVIALAIVLQACLACPIDDDDDDYADELSSNRDYMQNVGVESGGYFNR